MYKLINKNFFYIFRSNSGYAGSTIALGVVCCVLLITCFSTCLCLFKKCGELYRLRHPDKFRRKIKVSDEEMENYRRYLLKKVLLLFLLLLKKKMSGTGILTLCHNPFPNKHVFLMLMKQDK